MKGMFIIGLMLTLWHQENLTDSGSIAGIITNEEGNYISNANLLIEEKDKIIMISKVDEAGNYHFVLPVGEYSLKIEAAGYETLEFKNIEIESGIELETHASLSAKHLSQK